MTRIKFSNVAVHYGETLAVDAFDECLDAGEWLCLIGPNGAGKSSVLRAASSLAKYQGHITIDDKEVMRQSARWRARQIAFVPQSPLLPGDMIVADYVMLGRNPFIKPFAAESGHDHDVVVDVVADGRGVGHGIFVRPDQGFDLARRAVREAEGTEAHLAGLGERGRAARRDPHGRVAAAVGLGEHLAWRHAAHGERSESGNCGTCDCRRLRIRRCRREWL